MECDVGFEDFKPLIGYRTSQNYSSLGTECGTALKYEYLLEDAEEFSLSVFEEDSIWVDQLEKWSEMMSVRRVRKKCEEFL